MLCKSLTLYEMIERATGRVETPPTQVTNNERHDIFSTTY
jgi:hypothetical protein